MEKSIPHFSMPIQGTAWGCSYGIYGLGTAYNFSLLNSDFTKLLLHIFLRCGILWVWRVI